MSKDIRSFFKAGPVKKATPKLPEPAKRKVLEDDDDEVVLLSPQPIVKKKRRILDSDDEEKPKSKIESALKLETKAKLSVKKDEFSQDADDEAQDDETGRNKKTTPNLSKLAKLENNQEHKQVNTKKKSPIKQNEVPSKKIKMHSPKKSSPAGKEIILSSDSEVGNVEKSTEKRKVIEKIKTPTSSRRSVSKTNSELSASTETDEDRHEKKRLSAILYQKFKNRGGAKNPGSKEIPKGRPNCFNNLTFVITGLLDSMERDECADVIKGFGGKVVSAVSRKVNYMVVGEESGPAKLAKADEFGIAQITEDEFLELIKTKSDESGSNVIKKENTAPHPKLKSSLEKIKSVQESPKLVKVKMEIEKLSPEFVKQEKSIKVERQSPPNLSKHVDTQNLNWVDKYRPENMKQIVGQQGAASNSNKLLNWLSKWYTNNASNKKPSRPNPWDKNPDGSAFRAALLSGPPGVGKTTTAHLVCKELGFDFVEFNASDTRSKKLLKDQVSEILSSKSLSNFCSGKDSNENAVSKKHVLIMDEVDGMAGNEDRGGIQELISLIKDSCIPVICMCNDRNHQKMRSFGNYCFDLRFAKPRLEQIKGPMMSLCFKEGIKIPPKILDDIILATNCDLRQTINYLAIYAVKGSVSTSSNEDSKLNDFKNFSKKDLKLGPWDVVRKVFSADEHAKMSFYDKSDLFFMDYSMGPLFVQQNYLQVSPSCPRNEVMDRVAQTADSLSTGDLVERKIRSGGAWGLLPTQAVFSSVIPGECMSGRFTGQINFPGWLGKFSKSNKRNRMAQEVHDHTRIRTSGSKLSIRLDYAPILLDKIVRPLKVHGADGVAESLSVLKEYQLLREDLESLIELSTWPGKKNPMDAVDSKVKAALTRAYNKEMCAHAGVKRKKEKSDESELMVEEADAGFEEDSDEEDTLENDTLIKAKVKSRKTADANKKDTNSKKKKDSSSTTGKAGTSKTGKSR